MQMARVPMVAILLRSAKRITVSSDTLINAFMNHKGSRSVTRALDEDFFSMSGRSRTAATSKDHAERGQTPT